MNFGKKDQTMDSAIVDFSNTSGRHFGERLHGSAPTMIQATWICSFCGFSMNSTTFSLSPPCMNGGVFEIKLVDLPPDDPLFLISETGAPETWIIHCLFTN